MKLTNEMKTKVENLLSKTGLDIELIEKESNWEGVYCYQLLEKNIQELSNLF